MNEPMILNQLGLRRDQVEAMTRGMKPRTIGTVLAPAKPARTYYQPPSNIEVRDAAERCLRTHIGEWLDSARVAAAIGTDATLAGNVLAGMVRSGMAIEKKINDHGRPEYRWMGGAL